MSEIKAFMEMERDKMKRTIGDNRRKVNLLPKGVLTVKVVDSKKYLCRTVYWEEDGEKKQKSNVLKKEQRSLAIRIQERRLLQTQTEIMQRNLRVIDRFLGAYQPCDRAAVRELLPKAYRETLCYRGFDGVQLEESEEESPLYPEQLIHRNSVGQMYRSKAEMQISELLLQCKVEYEYEPELTIESRKLRPDFLVYHPKSKEKIYIEYFGMMDLEEYAQKAIHKISLYLRNNYLLGKNILFLFESNHSGFDVIATRKLIETTLS